MSRITQSAFVAGEVSPSVYGRVDLASYMAGLRECKNFVVCREGGVISRPGMAYCWEVKDSSKTVILIPFQFAENEACELEVGPAYLRVGKNGALLLAADAPAWDAAYAYGIGSHCTVTGTAYRAIAASTNQTPPNPTYWEAAGTYVEIVTPWIETHLTRLKHFQSGDVITVCHAAYMPREIRRYGDYDWRIAEITTTPQQQPPTNVQLDAEDPGGNAEQPAKAYQYTVTAVSSTGEESIMATAAGVTCNLQSNKWVTVTWTAPPGDTPTSYNVYRKYNSWAYIGSTPGATRTFKDDNFVATYGDTPPSGYNPFPSAAYYPNCGCYYQGRACFARDQLFVTSGSGEYRNFTKSDPPADDESIVATIASKRIDEIREMLPLEVLLLFTAGAEWALTGDEANMISPGALGDQQISQIGSAWLPPIVPGKGPIFVSGSGRGVYDLAPALGSGGQPADLTFRAAHLFVTRTFVSWTYQEKPWSVIWCAMSDGALLSLTLLRADDIWAWAKHETDGAVEHLISVIEGSQNEVYMVVNRTIDGATKRYVERMTNRYEADLEDLVLLDSAITYDGRNAGATTMTVSGTTYLVDERVTITRSAGVWATTDVGQTVRLTAADGTLVDFTILSRTNDTQVEARSQRDVPADLQATATTSWALARLTITGLAHLEGKTVGGLGDGSVIAEQTVDGGQITIDVPVSLIHIGLPYTCQIETLDLAVAGQSALRGRKKLVNRVWVLAANTRGLEVAAAVEPGMTERWYEMPERLVSEGYYDPIEPKTEEGVFDVAGNWNMGGRVLVRQQNPLPANILSVTPEVNFGG